MVEDVLGRLKFYGESSLSQPMVLVPVLHWRVAKEPWVLLAAVNGHLGLATQ